jgi:voltage-gated potassium channel
MAIITVSTVGFGEVHPLGTYGRLFTSFLVIFNIGLFAYGISTLTGIFAEGGFHHLFKNFRMNANIENLQGHTIVCGYGRHATEVTRELVKQGVSFVVIEKHPDKLENLRKESGILYVEGDATQDSVLEEAGIRRAKCVVVTLPDDSDNLFIVLSARQINPALRIISRANNRADELKIRRAGADHTVVPEAIGGFYMATLVNNPELVEFFTLLSNMGHSNVEFEELPVGVLQPQFVGRSMEATGIHLLAQVSIIALRDEKGGYHLNPLSSTVLEPGWQLVLLGNQDQIKDFKRKAERAEF